MLTWMIDPDYIGLLLQTGVRGEYVWNIEDPLNCSLGLWGPVILTFQWEAISREDDKWLRPFRNKKGGSHASRERIKTCFCTQ